MCVLQAQNTLFNRVHTSPLMEETGAFITVGIRLSLIFCVERKHV